jgi:hypothetical protein
MKTVKDVFQKVRYEYIYSLDISTNVYLHFQKIIEVLGFWKGIWKLKLDFNIRMMPSETVYFPAKMEKEIVKFWSYLPLMNGPYLGVNFINL